MTKRILICSLAYYPNHVSGAEVAVREITDRIAPDDITFELVTLWFDRALPKEERVGNVLVHRIGFGPRYISKILFVPLVALAARRLHRTAPFNGMWAVMTYMIFPLVLARWLGVQVPYVVTLQDGDPYEKVFERWFIRPVAWLLDRGLRQAAVVQAISTYLATWPEKRGAHVPVEVVYNGADPRDFMPELYTKDELMAARRALGVADGDVLLGNTARLVRQKGWEDTITALTLLPAHMKLLVVGGGPDDVRYRELATTLSVADRVIFVGHVDRSEVTKYRRMLDIFVMPSRSEGLGNAGLSAMASRVPVIATQVGGMREYVFDAAHDPDHAATAWVVAPDSPREIAEAVEDIIAHPDKVRTVTEAAHAFVSERFQWDAIARAMRTRVFARIVGDASAAS